MVHFGVKIIFRAVLTSVTCRWALGIAMAAGFVLAKKQIDARRAPKYAEWADRQREEEERERKAIQEWERSHVMPFVVSPYDCDLICG